MNSYAPYQEHHSAAAMPEGWTETEFDDAHWPPARAIGTPPVSGPAVALYERDIPLLEQTPLAPVGVAYTEECIGLVNRNRPQDLSISLSAVGTPVENSRIEDLASLVEGRDGCRLACSDNHLRGYYDGVHDPCFVLDFGRVVTACVEFDCTAPRGASLEFGYAERLIDGRFNNAIESQFADGYQCREGRQTYRFLHWRAFRYLKVRLRECPQGLALHYLRAVRTRYPFEERGAFASNDETLNGVFEISRETIRLCSIDQLMDTPWREGAQWLGDVSAATLPGIYACFGDERLPGKFIRQAAGASTDVGLLAQCNHLGGGGVVGRAPIPDYSLWWTMALWNHYMYTGQQAWIRTYYAEAFRIIRYHLHHLDDSGFLSRMPGWLFIDWAAVDKGGTSAVYNAVFAGALEAVANMAGLVGDSDSAAWMGALHGNIRENFTGQFFDAAKGVFADGHRDGVLSDNVSEHANFAALRFGCCSEGLGRGVIARFYESGNPVPAVECQPFFMLVVLDALRRWGRGDLALRLIRERWGRRMLDAGATSCFEEWTTNGSWRSGQWQGIMRTHSHAWSACPAEFLIRQLSGIEILAPGCAAIRVAPLDCDIDYQAVFPTPKGPLAVTRRQGRITVEPPEGVAIR
jgi:hypothetical protein